MESDNTKVHSNNARARLAQFAALSSRAIYSDFLVSKMKLHRPAKSLNVSLHVISWFKKSSILGATKRSTMFDERFDIFSIVSAGAIRFFYSIPPVIILR